MFANIARNMPNVMGSGRSNLEGTVAIASVPNGPGRGECGRDTVPHERGSLQRELLLVVLDHLLALSLCQVIRVADRVYAAAASPMKLIFPSAGPTDRC